MSLLEIEKLYYFEQLHTFEDYESPDNIHIRSVRGGRSILKSQPFVTFDH